MRTGERVLRSVEERAARCRRRRGASGASAQRGSGDRRIRTSSLIERDERLHL